ncbi:Acyl transferase domain-containing protein [Nocardia amikacinitolerans]|nr:type I polyketide synthase [Nocardia amikacinitolerans]MCP2291898.1 Acyl transferase domain-containing protein [Nocardia amikacinitolerans]
MSDPIAIVGMGCRFGGGIESPDALWRLVLEGRDVVAPFPDDRGWDLAALMNPDPHGPGASPVRKGAFLRDAGGFDADFFRISPREAIRMDPQQRVFLETAWEALEDAGIDPKALCGTDAGVFAGAMYHDYPTGMASGSMISGRLSYFLGLEGPAVTVDTASSSSLVALHQAVGAVRSGECRLALAGGVTVLATPAAFLEFSEQGALASDGRCKPFAASADGTGWGEGVGVLVLERLTDAERLGHNVLAVVRGTAVNQDGGGNGFTAPNGEAQERLIRRALAVAGLAADDVDYVEAHGSGTTVGDPIEAEALLATYGQRRHDRPPLRLGSVKSNIGHTAAAAGVAGVVTMVQAMRHGIMPAAPHGDSPNPTVRWEIGRVELATAPVPWPDTGRPRRAAVSSFGLSGTNAHVILEQAPPEVNPPAPEGEGIPVAWLISGHSPAALVEQARRLLSHVRARPDLRAVDVSWSLLRRARHPHSVIVTGDSRRQLMGGLTAFCAGKPARNVMARTAATPGKTVFVFPGQGGQWLGMARELLAVAPNFAQAIAECEQAFAPHVDWSLIAILAGETSEEAAAGSWLTRVDIVQPVLFAVMVSIATWWRSVGVTPDAVIGHSQGEVAAAYIAGAMSLEDAALVTIVRSRLVLQHLAGHGGMAAVALSASEARSRLGGLGVIAVAATNSPTSVVVAGDARTVDEVVAECDRDGTRVTRIAVDYASHSRHVEPLREPLLAALAHIQPSATGTAFYSTVTGAVLDTAQLDAEYWYRNLRHTVQFEAATRALLDDGYTVFVECSPHPLLTTSIDEIGSTARRPMSATVVGSLRRNQRDICEMLGTAAYLDTSGVSVDWSALLHDRKPQLVPLPSYAFQHRRYWLAANPRTDPSPEPLGESARDANLPPLPHRLAGVAESEQGAILLRTVRSTVAATLGHDGADSIPPDRTFKELGVESLTAVEVRTRLAAATGLNLPSTLVFDYPTPESVARHIQDLFAASAGENGRNDLDGVASPGFAESASEAELRSFIERLKSEHI